MNKGRRFNRIFVYCFLARFILSISIVFSSIYAILAWADKELILGRLNWHEYLLYILMAIPLVSLTSLLVFIVKLRKKYPEVNLVNSYLKNTIKFLPHLGIIIAFIIFPYTINSNLTVGAIEKRADNEVNQEISKSLNGFLSLFPYNLNTFNTLLEHHTQEEKMNLSINETANISAMILNASSEQEDDYLIRDFKALDSSWGYGNYGNYTEPKFTNTHGSTEFKTTDVETERIYYFENILGVFERKNFDDYPSTNVNIEISDGTSLDTNETTCYTIVVMVNPSVYNKETKKDYQECSNNGTLSFKENIYHSKNSLSGTDDFLKIIILKPNSDNFDPIITKAVIEENKIKPFEICFEGVHQAFTNKPFRAVLGYHRLGSFVVIEKILDPERGTCTQLDPNKLLRSKSTSMFP